MNRRFHYFCIANPFIKIWKTMKKTLLLLSILFLSFSTLKAQDGVDNCLSYDNYTALSPAADDSLYKLCEMIPDQWPEYAGEAESLVKYLSSNLQYPLSARMIGVQGKVYVRFIVHTDGHLSSAQIVKAIGAGCDEEALRVVKSMPKWKPALKHNRPVMAAVNLPINFTLKSFEEDPNAQVINDTLYIKDKTHDYAITEDENKNAMIMGKNRDVKDFQAIEKMPEYYGGIDEMYRFLGENIKYPRSAVKQGIQGRVFVNFIVEADGSITNVKVLSGIGSGCDEEAVRVVKSMPKWKPGQADGKNIRVNLTLPITFKL